MTQSIPIYIAVEDELSECVARRILKERPVPYALGHVLRRGGFGYLRKSIGAFDNLAKGCPVLLLTDLDNTYACASALIADWTRHPLQPNFMLRVAVREVESWLLGDGLGLSEYLFLKQSVIIAAPEDLYDPKEELLRNALKSPVRRIRDSLVWQDHRTGKLYQGPDYNATLCRYVTNQWNIAAARSRCLSLERLFAALQRLEDRL